MTFMADMVEAYKREVAVPGTFATVYPSTTNLHIEGALMDAFGEAQLDGFFPTMTLDVDARETTPDLSVAGQALVVIYAGTRSLHNTIREFRSSVRYKAGPVEYEVQRAASNLTELLRDARARREALLALANRSRYATVDYVLDGYIARIVGLGGFGAYELPQVA